MRIKLEGRLVGPWVNEVDSVWTSLRAGEQRLSVDLCSVSAVDENGKELLSRMHRNGTELIADAPMTKYIVAEAVREAESLREGRK